MTKEEIIKFCITELKAKIKTLKKRPICLTKGDVLSIVVEGNPLVINMGEYAESIVSRLKVSKIDLSDDELRGHLKTYFVDDVVKKLRDREGLFDPNFVLNNVSYVFMNKKDIDDNLLFVNQT